MYVYACVCGMHVSMHTALYVCEDQRTIFRSWLLPSTVGSRNQTQVAMLAQQYPLSTKPYHCSQSAKFLTRDK